MNKVPFFVPKIPFDPTQTPVTMFRAHKAYADAAGARFAAHRGRNRGLGRQHVRQWPDDTLPPTTSLFGGYANTRSVSLLGPAAQKRILKEHLKVKKITANGLEIFSALLDRGVNFACDVAKQIHDVAVGAGASKDVFGTDKHVEVARAHTDIRDAPVIPNTVVTLRQNLSAMARQRMNDLPEHKKTKKKNYQFLPSYVKALYTKLNKIAKTANRRIYTSSAIKASVGMIQGLNETARSQVEKTLGQITLEGVAHLDMHTAFLTADAQSTFFPAHKLLIGASAAKWMSYETAFILFTLVGTPRNLVSLFETVLGRKHTAEDLMGFYKQYKLFSKDMHALLGHAETTPARLYQLQVAAAKAVAISTEVLGASLEEKTRTLGGHITIPLLHGTYFRTVEAIINHIDKRNPANVHASIRTMIQQAIGNIQLYEEYFHGAGGL